MLLIKLVSIHIYWQEAWYFILFVQLCSTFMQRMGVLFSIGFLIFAVFFAIATLNCMLFFGLSN